MYANLKTELYAFYLHGDAERAKSFADKCFPIWMQDLEKV